MKPVYPFSSEIERALYRLGVNGIFLQILREELKKEGLDIGRGDAEQFQRKILNIVSSMKETPRAKIDQVKKEIEDTASGILDMVDFSLRGSLRHSKGMPPSLNREKEKLKDLRLTENTHTVKNSLYEVKWITTFEGKRLGFLQKVGPNIHLYGVGAKGLLGWFNPTIGDEGMTFNRQGQPIGFGNQLTSLLKERLE